jgi:AcrR family transcriptional regulator
MAATPAPLGRRERNKQDKLERTTTAAGALFARYGVDEVTTQQIADAADIGTGTLFLYAKTKGELLLLVQNAHYETALTVGRAAASRSSSALDAIVALLTPIVDCNRVNVENGRTYLREMLFGDAAEARHAEALAIVSDTATEIAAILSRHAKLGASESETLAQVVSAISFVTMASSEHLSSTVPEIVEAMRAQIATVLPR